MKRGLLSLTIVHHDAPIMTHQNDRRDAQARTTGGAAP